MALFKNSTAKAEDELAVARRRAAQFQAEDANLAARDSDDLDFDARFALGEERALSGRKVAAAVAEVSRLERSLAEAKAAEAQAEVDRRYKEGEKLAVVGVRLTENVEAAVNQLAAAIAAAEANRAQIEAVNAERGNRPQLLDGERRVREVPDRIIPAEYEMRDVYRDASGRTPSQFRTDAKGNLVPSEAGFEKRRERVLIRGEQHVPGGMPERYVDAIVLVNRKGERIRPVAG